MLRESRWWQTFAGNGVFTRAAWWLTAPGAALTTPVVTPGAIGRHDIGWLILGLTAHLLCGLFIVVVRPFALATEGAPRVRRTVAVLLAAGALRGVYIGMSSAWLQWADGWHLGLRVPASSITLAFWFSIAAVVVDGGLRHRHTMAETRSAVRAQQLIIERSEQWIQSFREDVVEQTRRKVTEQLTRATEDSADAADAARRLHEIVEEVIRPLSRELEAGEDLSHVELIAQQSLDAQRVPFREYVARITHGDASRPVASAVVWLGTATVLCLHLYGPVIGLLAVAASALALHLSVTVSARGISSSQARVTGNVRRLLAVLFAWSLNAVVAAAALFLVVGATEAWVDEWNLGDAQLRLGTFVLAWIVAVAAQVAASAVYGLGRLREDAERRLLTIADDISWATSRVRQEAWAEQRRLGKALHGNVQARIVSLALQLQIHDLSDPASEIAALSHEIEAALHGDAMTPWDSATQQLQDLWADVIDIRWMVSQAAESALHEDVTAAHALAEVLRESITNAVRHASADRVRVSIDLAGGILGVRVANDGRPLPATRAAGLGSALYDAVCLDWSLRQGAAETIFFGRVATIAGADVRERSVR